MSSTFDKYKNNFSKYLDLSSDNSFLYIGLFIITLLLLIYILNNIYYNYNKSLFSFLNFKKLYPFSPTLISVVDNPNYHTYGLRSFFIKTAYNCCSTNNFKDGELNLDALKLCISQGVRCLDFEIDSLNNNPVVTITNANSTANSTANANKNIETYNTLPIESVLTTITELAFSSGSCSNFNDPIILHFRIMNKIAKMYNNFAKIISNLQQFHSLLLGKEYSHEYHGKNLGAVPIINFKRKIIIVIHGVDTFYQSTALDEYINMASGQAFLHLIRYNDLKYNQDTKLTEFNKKNMSIVLPNQKGKLENPSFNLSREYGCQFIGMSFPNNDINLQQYNLFFNNHRFAFVLKPKGLR